jgi:hypothetical protein
MRMPPSIFPSTIHRRGAAGGAHRGREIDPFSSPG